MEIIEFNILETPASKEEIVLVLGYFDGLHLGHQALIKQAMNEGYPVAVLTFDNAPSFILHKKITNTCLTSVMDKALYLNEMGVKYLYLMHFDENTIYYSKDEFIELVLKKINPQKIFVGEDYSFGAWGNGNAQYLTNFFDTHVQKLSKIGNEKISSRVIREYVANGEISKAMKLLGRPYRISGLVVHGKHNGTFMSFPTANLDLDYPYVFPKNGVYAGYADIYGEKRKVVICVGTHPTIMPLSIPIIEVHVLDYKENLYGKTLFVDFVTYIRNVERFDNIEDLKAQIEKDIEFTKKTLQ